MTEGKNYFAKFGKMFGLKRNVFKKTYTSAIVVLVMVVSMSSCAAWDVQGRWADVQKNVHGWIGFDVDRLVITWGAPAARTKLSTGAEVLTYRLSLQDSRPHWPGGIGTETTVYSNKQLDCEVTFVTAVDAKVIVETFSKGHLAACEQLTRFANPEGLVVDDPS